MRLLSSSGSDVYNQPLPMGTTLAIDQSTKSYQTFWTVPAAGTYTLQITSADPAVGEALHWYYLTVWKAKDGTPVVKAIDMLRSVGFLYRYLRAEPTATANTLTISHTGGSDKSSLFSMDSGSQFSLSALETASAFENTNTYTVSTGYYLAKYGITLGTSADLGYETKTYNCPYHSDYSDLRGIFKPCTAATPSNTFTIPAATGSTFGDSLLQLADQSDSRPTHDLGVLSQGQQVEVSVNFPRPTGKTPTSFKLTLLDQSNNSGRPQTSPSQFDSASIPSSLPSTPLRKVLDRRRIQSQSLQRWTLRPLPVLLEPASSEPTTSLTNVYPPKSTTSVTGKSAGEAVQSDLSCGLKTCAFGEILDLITGNYILEPVSPRAVPGQRLLLPPAQVPLPQLLLHLRLLRTQAPNI